MYKTEVVIELPAQLTLVEGITGIESERRRYSLLPPLNLTADLFQPLNLTCHSSGNPEPVTTWYKDGKQIYNLTNTLEFSELNLTNRGYYRCRVRNYLGEELSGTFLLNISGDWFSSLLL